MSLENDVFDIKALTTVPAADNELLASERKNLRSQPSFTWTLSHIH